MAGPWEQSQQTAAPSGPWAQYALTPAAAPAASEIPAPRAEVPAWARQYPRLYGVAGAARETLGPLLEMGGWLAAALSVRVWGQQVL